MTKRKIGEQGRFTIPKDILDKFNIKKDDWLDIETHEDHIRIKKYVPEYVCVITGKVTSQGKQIGNSFISNEGLKIIKEVLAQYESKQGKAP